MNLNVFCSTAVRIILGAKVMTTISKYSLQSKIVSIYIFDNFHLKIFKFFFMFLKGKSYNSYSFRIENSGVRIFELSNATIVVNMASETKNVFKDR